MPLVAPNGPSGHPKPRRKAGLVNALRALADGTDFARRQAALDLMGMPDAVPALCDCLAREAVPTVRQALLDALVSVGDAQVVDTLIGMLGSDEASRRNEAVISLQLLSTPVAARMSGLLSDPDPDIRIMALDILRMLPHPDTPRWLATLLARETHPNVVGVTVDRLAEIGDREHLPALEAARARFADEPYLVFAINFVIDRIQTLEREGKA